MKKILAAILTAGLCTAGFAQPAQKSDARPNADAAASPVISFPSERKSSATDPASAPASEQFNAGATTTGTSSTALPGANRDIDRSVDAQPANSTVNTATPPGRSSVTVNRPLRTSAPAPVDVVQPPPNAIPEVRIAASAANQVWIPGSYTWHNNQWRWTAGAWTVPPQAGAVWRPGSYNAATKQWTEGHWSPRSAPSKRSESP